MANTHSTQPFPKPPKQPLFLSMAEVQALLTIDHLGITRADGDAQDKLEALANCLATEVLNFVRTYPHTPPAGLCLEVTVLLPVWVQKRMAGAPWGEYR